jgi:hypothetical protein
MRKKRRTRLSRQRTYLDDYIRLHDRIDRLEDSINYFYNVLNELRERVSALEKKLNL